MKIKLSAVFGLSLVMQVAVCAAESSAYNQEQAKRACWRLKNLVNMAAKYGLFRVPSFFDATREAGKQLHENGSSTCECIKALLRQKKKKALQGIQNAYSLSDEHMENYKKEVQKKKLEFSEPAPRVKFVNGDLSPYQRELIAQKANQIGLTFSVSVHVVPGTDCWADGVNEIKLGERPHPEDIKHLVNRELTHIKKFNRVKAEAVGFITQDNFDNPQHPQEFLKFQRYMNAQADRLMPACGGCDDAFSSYMMFKKQRKYNKLIDFYSCQDDSYSRNIKRFLWSAAIYSARQGESLG